MLETIAIGAVVNAPTIQPFDTVKSRHFIYQARREQDLARPRSKAIRARNREMIPAGADTHPELTVTRKVLAQ